MTKKGPWNEEEDSRLVHYININGEGRWDSLARTAGLARTGKSCRLRWLNYLRPGIRHGNFTTREQLMILELHFQWGNRWSKIAQHLPGRTDNEIKNYWRTRVEKQAKHLKCGVNSKQFKETMRNVWMPRLAEQVRATTSGLFSTTAEPSTVVADHCADVTINHDHDHDHAAAATCTSEMAVSSNPRDEWLLDINDPLLDVNGTSQHNYSFHDHDLMLLDNLWN